jgi:hypothetical protein
MGESIRTVLGRREDLSTFLVHLCRNRAGVTAVEALMRIVTERRLRAMTPMGWAKSNDDPSDSASQSQRTVCFSETPLQHVHSLFADIEGRSIRLEPFGLALTKVVARRVGVNPVWYVDMTTAGGREWAEARALDAIRDGAVSRGNFHSSPESKVLPFCEHMGTWPCSRKEFWWEREWRHRGDLDLASIWAKVIWLAPEEHHESVARAVAGGNGNGELVLLDPRWGVEEIIARRCGLDPADVSLFHASVSREDSNGIVRSSERVGTELSAYRAAGEAAGRNERFGGASGAG